MKPITLPDSVDVARLKSLRQQIKCVRQWLDGWSAGSGKDGPADRDGLRQVMVIFDEGIGKAEQRKPVRRSGQ